jgi:hypothetical protein
MARVWNTPIFAIATIYFILDGIFPASHSRTRHGSAKRSCRSASATGATKSKLRLYPTGLTRMPWRGLRLAFVLSLVSSSAGAAGLEWQRYSIHATGLTVDVPTAIFEDAGPTEGTAGRQFFTKDRRADLTVKSVPNPDNDSPAAFLNKMQPPARMQYRRVTPAFFAVSSIRNGRTWYNRCNRANGFMNCVLINYPAAEERQWDAVVTRISLSLSK